MVSYSGTYSYSLSLADIGVESFERAGVRASGLTPDHMISLRRSLNLVQVKAANRGVNLFTVDLQSVPLVQGVTKYSVPTSTIMMLDVYLRTYEMGQATSLLPTFSTTINSSTVTITWANNGLSVSDWIQVIIPVSIGGIILYGYYQVVSTPTVNTFTITAAQNAVSSATGGAVPAFTTDGSTANISVFLADNGYLAGDTFVVQISTLVGGVTLLGNYTIASITDADNFVITASYPSSSVQTVSENDGLAQLAGQNVNADPIDRILRPISRTEYASFPDKQQQAPPTVYYFDRQINPTVTLWQVPDQNGPYELRYYRSTQIEDANAVMGQNPAIPYRFYEAYCAELAAHLAVKWAPDRLPMLQPLAAQAWAEAASEDSERVSTFIMPDMSSFFN